MADTFDLELKQGGTYERVLTFKEDGVVVPLAPFTVKAQIRAKEDPNSKLLLDLAPYMTVVEDTVVLRIPGPVTAALRISDFKRGTAAWDLFLIQTDDPTQAEPWVQGGVSLDPAATQTLVVS